MDAYNRVFKVILCFCHNMAGSKNIFFQKTFSKYFFEKSNIKHFFIGTEMQVPVQSSTMQSTDGKMVL